VTRIARMIDSRTPVLAAVAPESGSDRRRRWGVASLIIMALLLAGGMVLPILLPSAQPAAPALAPSFSAAPVTVPPSLSPSISATSKSVPQDPLALPGAVPAHGSGKFSYAPGRGNVLGTKGPLRRFRVAVEQGSNEDTAGFAAQVEATLGDERSWVGDGQLRLQRVSGAEAASFTVYLATRDTAGRMCSNGGVTITVGGRPYTSCRTTGRAIINLDRWRLSAPPYLTTKVPLTVYRQYVVNHEVGHELGRQHQGCPKRGGPAPVMVQQTLTLRGCVAYAWPRLGGRRFEGPSV
jgi:hypothetical protein